MTRILSLHPRSPRIWFHGGEFSDSLALASITGELASFFDFFYHHPRTGLELRTKSANLKALNSLAPADNIVVSYSLSPSGSAQELDLKARLRAIANWPSETTKLPSTLIPLWSPCNLSINTINC